MSRTISMQQYSNQPSEVNVSNQQVDRKQQSDGILSFDKVLSDIGIGKYQLAFYFIMGTLGLTEGSQVSVFTLMIPILKHQWNVDDYLNSLQTSLVFIGFLFGSMISGQFSDRFGRKRPFIYSSGLTCIFTLATAFSQNIYQLSILRALIGILVGFFGPLGVTLLAEVTPQEVRGRYMSLITISFSIGQIYGIVIGMLTLENLQEGNWRMMTVWTVLPGFIAWICGIFLLDESARFALCTKDFDLAFSVLNKMNQANGCKNFIQLQDTQKQELANWVNNLNVNQNNQEQGNIQILFQDQGKTLTPMIWINWFTTSFVYYGILVLLPYMLDQIDQNTQNNGDNDMLKLIFTAVGDIVSAAVASFLIELKGFGRKNSMIIFFVLQGMSCFIVYLDEADRFIIWCTISKMFLSMNFIFNYQFTAEIYPTKIRTTGIGMANGIGRMGGVIVPWISMSLMHINLLSPFLLFSAISLLTALMDLWIPFDTTGIELDSVYKHLTEKEDMEAKRNEN